MAADRSQQPAVLRRKIERLEAQLAAEQKAHTEAIHVYRVQAIELIELRMRIQDAEKALRGEL